MRCCLLTFNLEGGGAERQLVQLAQHWPFGSDALEIVLLEQRGAWLAEVPNGTNLKALTRRVPGLGPLKPLWALRQLPKVRRLLRERDYDVVVTFLWLPTVLVALALDGLPSSRRPRLVWSVQSDLERDFQLHADGRLRRWVVRRVLPPRVDHFIAVSHGLRDRTRRLLQVPEERFTVIPNSIDLARIREMAARATMAKVPPKRAEARIISVGRLHPAKGFDTLLQALRWVRERTPNFECWIVGDGPERGRLHTLVERWELTGHVSFAGHVHNPYAWLASSDLFISPSRWETFGIAIAEAMALGLPVVATATDGARELIDHQRDGLLVPVEDAQALAEAILTLLEDATLRQELGRRAQQKAQRFDAPLIARKYAQTLESILC